MTKRKEEKRERREKVRDNSRNRDIAATRLPSYIESQQSDFEKAFIEHIDNTVRRGIPEQHSGEGEPEDRRWDSLAELCEDGGTCSAIAFKDGTIYIAANTKDNEDLAMEYIRCLQDVASGKNVDARRDGLIKQSLKVKGKGNNGLSKERLETDFAKIMSYIKNRENQDLNDALLKGRFDYVTGDAKLHAEMKLLQKFYNEDSKQIIFPRGSAYIGISRLCCGKCQSAINALNKVSPGVVKTRGTHGGMALGEWTMPEFLKQENNPKLFEAFVGEKSNNRYNQTIEKPVPASEGQKVMSDEEFKKFSPEIKKFKKNIDMFVTNSIAENRFSHLRKDKSRHSPSRSTPER